MEEDFFVDEIHDRKKRKNSKAKGKTGEREIVNLFNERFAEILKANPTWGKFQRCVGSGNRWSQTTLSDNEQNVFAGDVRHPHFRFVIESKKGYDVDLAATFEGGDKTLDGFLQQVESDSQRSKKDPMLIWKKDRRPYLVFVKVLEGEYVYLMKYREWNVVALKDLLKLPDAFFFQS